jgi:uncharacterized membrane protein YdjX (TVP38/TMEM64 family)
VPHNEGELTDEDDPRLSEVIEDPPSLLPVLTTLVGILAIAGLIALIPGLREAAQDAIAGDTEALRTELEGATGVLTLLVLALLHAIIFYPAEILDAAAGFVWGFWLGLPLVMIGWLINAVAAWLIGRHAAHPLLYRLVGHDRFVALEVAIERGGAFLLLAMRLIPIVPFSLFTIVAGAARVPLGRLLWTTAVGYLPLTALFVYLGTQLEELSPTNPILIGGGIALLIVVYTAHRMRHRLLDPRDER